PMRHTVPAPSRTANSTPGPRPAHCAPHRTAPGFADGLPADAPGSAPEQMAELTGAPVRWPATRQWHWRSLHDHDWATAPAESGRARRPPHGNGPLPNNPVADGCATGQYN